MRIRAKECVCVCVWARVRNVGACVSVCVLKNVCVSVCKFAAEGGKLQTRVPPLIPKCIKYEKEGSREGGEIVCHFFFFVSFRLFYKCPGPKG